MLNLSALFPVRSGSVCGSGLRGALAWPGQRLGRRGSAGARRPGRRPGGGRRGSPGWLQPRAPRLNPGRNAIYRPRAAPASTQTFAVAPPPPPEPNIREKTPRPFPQNPNLAGTRRRFHTTFCLPADVSSFSEQLCKGRGGVGAVGLGRRIGALCSQAP